MKNSSDEFETLVKNQADAEEINSSCQVRRKIEDHLERRRYQDELGELDNDFDFVSA